MQTIVIIWLIVSLLTTVLVIATLMLSSRVSQEEGVTESYEDWKATEVTREVYQQQVEQ